MQITDVYRIVVAQHVELTIALNDKISVEIDIRIPIGVVPIHQKLAANKPKRTKLPLVHDFYDQTSALAVGENKAQPLRRDRLSQKEAASRDADITTECGDDFTFGAKTLVQALNLNGLKDLVAF
ncbi:MAG: hypothetical protein WBD20_21235 [Pirellulaceae bacterium]